MLNFKNIRNEAGDIVKVEIPESIKGQYLLNTPKLNKSCAFTQEERIRLGISGKLPSYVETLEQQAARFYEQYQTQGSDLEKNVYLNSLHDSNETLFYRLVSEHVAEMLPIVYTPTIGDAVIHFSHELRRTRGLFLSYEDMDRLPEILENRLDPDVNLILVTDGEGVLGIGDQGIGGMDIAIGKLTVYTLCAGVSPHHVLPIQLDVGTNNKELLDDPMYLGWRHARISGKQYDEFIAAFIAAVKKVFPWVFLHWEDFGRDNARRNLDTYRDELCSFNDDMQGTGATALASITAGILASKTKMKDQRIVVFGAGTAGCGVTDQIHDAMMRHGVSNEDACKHFWLIDRPGLLVHDQKDLLPFQKPYARAREELKDWEVKDPNNITLEEVVRHVKPTILIGCSTITGAFNETVVKEMAKHVEHPIIFPMSNPTSKSEAHPKDLLAWTDGKALIATGSPYKDVDFKGKKIRISQSNNAFIFPGLGLGIIACQAKKVSDGMLWAAAKTLAENSPAKKDNMAPLLPSIDNTHDLSTEIARAVIKAAIEEGLADPIDDIDTAIRAVRWMPKYYPYEYMKS